MNQLDATRANLVRHVSKLFAFDADFRSMIRVSGDDGTRTLICLLPEDRAGRMFDQVERSGGRANVVVPLGDRRLRVMFWTRELADDDEDLVPCSDEATMEMLMAVVDQDGGAVAFDRHPGMVLAGALEFAAPA